MRTTTAEDEHDKNEGNIKAIFFGIMSGLMVGIGGLSGGGPIVAGLLLMGLDMIQAAATSSYVLVFNTIIGLFFHLSGGGVNWNFGIFLMIGSIIGAALTPILIKKIANPTGINRILWLFY